jgi:hypothetical protein
MPVIDLSLAGWCVRLEIEEPGLAREVVRRYGAFLTTADAVPRLTARVELTAPGSDKRTGSSLELTLSQASDTGEHRLDAPGFRASLDLEQGAGKLALASAIPLADLEHFLRVTVALLAFREGGVLIHAAGLLADAGVHLFIGQSGSGKSTVAALSPQALALNDDLIVLRPAGERWDAWGTPFWNIETARRDGQTAFGPLTGIYRLVQDTEVHLEGLSSAAATAELVANCPVVNGSPAHLAALLLRCRQLADAVPVRRLHFRKDGSFWPLIQQSGPDS